MKSPVSSRIAICEPENLKARVRNGRDLCSAGAAAVHVIHERQLKRADFLRMLSAPHTK